MDKSHDDDQKVILFGWCANLQRPLLYMDFAETKMFMDLFEPADEFFVIEKSLSTYLHIPDHGCRDICCVIASSAEKD